MVKGRVARLAEEAEEAREGPEGTRTDEGGSGEDLSPGQQGRKGEKGRKAEGRPGGGSEQKKCHACGRRGHVRAECPRADGNKRRVTCTKKTQPKGNRGQWRGQEASGAEQEAQPALHDFGVGYVDPCCCLHGCFARTSHYGTAEAFLSACGVPQACEAVVAVFADDACLDPSSDRYRCWEALLLEDRVRGIFGCWPQHASALQQTVGERLEEWTGAAAQKVAGLAGGLDYGRDGCTEEDRRAQKAVLSQILAIARRRELPLMLCCGGGGADKDLAELMASSDLPPTHQVHLSSYTGDNDFLVLRFLPAWPNMRVGFDGRVTFTKAENVRRLLFDIPVERLILQSSSPHHLPTTLSAHGGGGAKSTCHPGVVPSVAKHVADLLEMDVIELMEAVRSNVRATYGI